MSQSMTRYKWDTIPWKRFKVRVFKLQKQIYRASQKNDKPLVRKLQRLLMKSYMAKCLAVRKVCQENKGKSTAGIDGKRAPTPQARFKLIRELGNLPTGKPLRRVWIPKPGKNEKRPLGIPVIYDRAMQALVKMALEPEWEAKFEPNSYGFRPGRSAHDAIGQLYNDALLLPKWVLDADIKGCFDNINHQALLSKIDSSPSFKRMIKSWLKAGILDQGIFSETDSGTPQGGVISPLLANIALHGLESHIVDSFPKYKWIPEIYKKAYWRPLIVRYADDFVIMHRDKETLLKCKELAETWLEDIGLKLSQEKTRIGHTLEEVDGQKPGFDFLGFNIRQYPMNYRNPWVNVFGEEKNFKLLIKPSKASVDKHYRKLKMIVDNHREVSTQAALIRHLNPVIYGWCNYFRTVVSKQTFKVTDGKLFNRLWRWAKRRHGTNFSRKRIKAKYWRKDAWIFSKTKGLKLALHARTKILRHVKVKANRSPYDGDWIYWTKRLGNYPGIPRDLSYLVHQQNGFCAGCNLKFNHDDYIKSYKYKIDGTVIKEARHLSCHPDRSHNKGTYFIC